MKLALMALLFNLKAFFNWCKEENCLINIEPNVWKAFFECHSSFAETPKSAEGIEYFFLIFKNICCHCLKNSEYTLVNYHQPSHFEILVCFFVQLRYRYRTLGLNGMGCDFYICKW